MDSTSSIQQALVAAPKHILDAWKTPPSIMNGYRRAERWDEAADFWRTLPIPTWEDDEFLQLIAKHHAIDSTSSVLDIGCGSGIYSFALAKRAKHVVGIDISSKMIEAANDRKEELGIQNVQFIHDDFLAHAFSERFDVVIAHMTPAMRDGDGFRKMLALTKRFGFTARPTRRSDSIADGITQLIAPGQKHQNDVSIPAQFLILWNAGITPLVSHYPAVWNRTRTLEEALTFYIDLQLANDTSEQHKEAVRAYLHAHSENGSVTETIKSEIVMMAWSMQHCNFTGETA